MIMTKWQWLVKQFGRRLWVRASMFCLLGILTALVAVEIKGFLPEQLSRKVGAESVDSLLKIIANSMLAVTTFSLSTMVAAYSAATNNVTPRSTRLLLQDSTAQNALSVFIGAFLYSLVGIIALSMQIYGESGRLILFLVTIGVIAVIIAVLLQWINYLSKLGRVQNTIEKVERVTATALTQRLQLPYLGGRRWDVYTQRREFFTVTHPQIGFVQHVDMGALNSIAKSQDVTLYLAMTPGSFNDSVRALLYSSGALEEDVVGRVRRAFVVDAERSFDQDPRYGLIVLQEIALRALSPAVNDPGTAIDILGTSLRLLSPWVAHQVDEEAEAHYPHMYVPPLSMEDMCDDMYRAIARDAAGNLQVSLRLQETLAALTAQGDANAKRALKDLSDYAMAHARHALTLDEDISRLEAVVYYRNLCKSPLLAIENDVSAFAGRT